MSSTLTRCKNKISENNTTIVKGTQALCWLRCYSLLFYGYLFKICHYFEGRYGQRGGQHLHVTSQALNHHHLHSVATGAWPTPTMPHAVPPKCICFTFAPTSMPAAADSMFPGLPARFFGCPEEASSTRYLQSNRRPLTWQRDYTFIAASCDQEAGGSSVGACLYPLSHHEYSMGY
jgi:hypothetical protein